VHRVLDTTGAGDCFTAAFAVANVEGRPDPEALRFAGVGAGCGANHWNPCDISFFFALLPL
jgi:sugar/nucleoside kinase (ribokinase family)